MGQAKVKENALRRTALAELERWLAPSTPEEIELAVTLSQKEIIEVPRVPAEAIEYMRMEPQQCHSNCTSYRKLDPEGKSQVVYGWWRRDTSYVFHSIISRDGQLFCITPYEFEDAPLDFIIDEDIVEHDIDGTISYTRLGNKVPKFARLDPERVISECASLKAKLLAGVPLKQAILVEARGNPNAG